jgi:hypothetical protein
MWMRMSIGMKCAMKTADGNCAVRGAENTVGSIRSDAHIRNRIRMFTNQERRHPDNYDFMVGTLLVHLTTNTTSMFPERKN